MRKPLLVALLTTIALSAPYTVAQPATKPEAKPTAPAMDMDKQMVQMQETMKKMQQQMMQHQQMMQPAPAK